MSAWLKRGVIGACAVIVIAQFIPVAKTNPPVDAAQTMTAAIPMPIEIGQILERACQDCHSNQTVWPWYSRIAPTSWLLAHHVNEGRRELNFSEWGRYNERRRTRKLQEICEQVRKGQMPQASYTLLHPQAKLTERDRDTICAWTDSARKAFASAHPVR